MDQVPALQTSIICFGKEAEELKHDVYRSASIVKADMQLLGENGFHKTGDDFRSECDEQLPLVQKDV